MCVYGTAHVLLYEVRIIPHLKFSLGHYPSYQSLLREAKYTLRSVFVGACMDAALRWALPFTSLPSTRLSDLTPQELATFLLIGGACVLWCLWRL